MEKQIVWRTGDFSDVGIYVLLFLMVYGVLRLLLTFARNRKLITQENWAIGLWLSIVVAGLIAALPTTYYAN